MTGCACSHCGEPFTPTPLQPSFCGRGCEAAWHRLERRRQIAYDTFGEAA